MDRTARNALAITAGVVIVASIAFGSWRLSPANNYDGCMVQETKGQPEAVANVARKLCAKRYKKEVRIPAPEIDWIWEAATGTPTAAIILKNSGQYVVTRGMFKFSAKSCTGAATPEWGAVMTGYFDKEIAIIQTGVISPICVTMEELWGNYK
jgi:hypothetical protein